MKKEYRKNQGVYYIQGRLLYDLYEIAKWESALNELLDTKLIVDRSYKGETFALTELGYKIADMIEL